MSEPKKRGAKSPGDASKGKAQTDHTAKDSAAEASADQTTEPTTGPEPDAADAGQGLNTGKDGTDTEPNAGATKASKDAEAVAEADAASDTASATDAASDTATDTEAATDKDEPGGEGSRKPEASYETGADDGEEALTEEEQREIAEAALRDAERGYVSDDGSYPSSDEKPRADAPEDKTEPDTATPDPVAASVVQPAAAEPVREVVVEKRGGVLAGVLGGVVAVVGAVFAAPYVLPENMRPVMSLDPVESELAEQSSQLGGIVERIDGIDAAVAEAQATARDTAAAVESRLAEMEASLRDSIEAQIANETAGLTGRIDDLAASLAQLERSPIEDATDPAVIAALEAFRREMQSVREEVAAQTEENTRVIEEAAEMTAEARAVAEAEAAAAAERAAEASRMQALADIKAALESGMPYGDALSAIGAEVPEALAAGQGGVATLAALQAAFAEPARDTLDTARRADVGDAPAERGLSFLQTQLGMRSLAPKEGDSADAILSRAEAALRDGDLPAAISELEALPAPALAEMQDWIARAKTRADAVAAADALAQSLATN